ncbi:MAG: MBL fold metallo-hydrolase [Akkermansia sp.]
MSTSPLEDDQQDVLHKALSMARLSPRDIPPDQSSESQQAFLRRIHLDPIAYLNMPHSIPTLSLPSGLQQHILPFEGWTLNIWTLQTPSGSIIIDTGLSPDQLKKVTTSMTLAGTPPLAILITHLHRDHIGGLTDPLDIPIYSPPLIRAHEQHSIGSLSWSTLDLSGHTPDGIGWLTEYHGTHLLFPGDSIFACSIGKCAGAEKLAMTNILNVMRAISKDTIICPGHGPATTVHLEWERNPFIAPYADK